MKHKKLLLTGHKGFIGSALKPLIRNDYEVCTPTFDLTDFGSVEKWIKSNKPNYLVHLGAVTSNDYYYKQPIKTLETNLMATINLAEACRNIENFKQFIYPSSILVYESNKSKLNENSAVKPLSSHGVAKIACDYYLKYLGNAYNFPYTILRLSNVYGRKNNNSYFIEGTISKMLKGENVEIKNPNGIRDWIYIDDVAKAFVSSLGNSNAIKKLFLIGSGEGHSTNEVAEKIAALTNFKGKIIRSKGSAPIKNEMMVCDSSKARFELDWKPMVSIEDGLAKTIKSLI